MGGTGAEHLRSLIGPFYGDGLTRPRLDASLARWSPIQLAREPATLNGAWFDYRFAHPALRAMFFAHCYTISWRRAHVAFFDRDEDVSNFHPWSSRNIYNCPDATLNRTIGVMQFADELRIPYDVFFDAGFKHLLQVAGYVKVMRKRSGLKAHKLPPIRLFKRADVALAAQQRMDALMVKRMVRATHPHFSADKWTGTPWQIEYARFQVSEALRRGPGATAHLAALKEAGVLRLTDEFLDCRIKSSMTNVQPHSEQRESQ